MSLRCSFVVVLADGSHDGIAGSKLVVLTGLLWEQFDGKLIRPLDLLVVGRQLMGDKHYLVADFVYGVPGGFEMQLVFPHIAALVLSDH